MKKEYIKMNNNDDHLSLGNLFRLIKELSKNKSSALQTEIFCFLFEIDEINDTTVNNYCVGCRGIGNDYKQIYLNKQKRYTKDDTIFEDIIINILSIIDGRIYVTDNKREFINKNESMASLCKKLYNIAKNDKSVNTEIITEVNVLLKENDLYKAFVELLFFIVLQKRQPLYESDLKKEVIENILNDTYMSSSGLQEYLILKLTESINFDFNMKKIALEGNAYACFEIGSNEYCGYVTGKPRYEEAYKYFKIAANYNHAGALYMIGNMYYKGYLGNKTNEDLELAYDYLIKARDLGNVAALNVLGVFYLNGLYPVKKDQEEAIKYFNKASDNNYAYALNNLGKIYENNGDTDLAFSYYLRSANLGESWACNKVGECFRNGIYTKKDIPKSFEYYKKAIESNHRTLEYYAYYNLALIYYNGNAEIGVTKDEDMAIEYLKIASSHNIIEASIDLLYITTDKYLKTREERFLEKINQYKKLIEINSKYNNDLKEKVEKKLKELSSKKEIDISFLINN